MNRFKAPWGKSLWVMSAIGTVICLAISIFFLRAILDLRVQTADFWIGILPLLLIAAAVSFMIRGYLVSGDSILVERLFMVYALAAGGSPVRAVSARCDAREHPHLWQWRVFLLHGPLPEQTPGLLSSVCHRVKAACRSPIS